MTIPSRSSAWATAAKTCRKIWANWSNTSIDKRSEAPYSNYTNQVGAQAYYQREIGVDGGSEVADILYDSRQDNAIFDMVMTIEKSSGLYGQWIFY
jgi:hypothetical protein